MRNVGSSFEVLTERLAHPMRANVHGYGISTLPAELSPLLR